MSEPLTIRGARLVLPDRVVRGDLLVAGGVIERIGPELGAGDGEEVDGDGLTVLPGMVDTLVDVPLVGDGDALAGVSDEAAAWGVTSLLLHDPEHPAVTAEVHGERLEHAGRHCRVHHGVYVAADSERPFAGVVGRTPGVRARAGRGGLDLEQLAALIARSERMVVVEGEDPAGFGPREALYAGAHDPGEHARIYVPELAAEVVRVAVQTARRHGARLLLGRVSSAAEIEAAGEGCATVQATAPHLFLQAEDACRRLGVRAVTEPPLRAAADVAALWDAVDAGRIVALASGHGSVRLADKERPYPLTPRALPSIGTLMPLLLQRVADGLLGLTDVARLTAEAPARVVGLQRTGRLEVGYDADLVLVDADADVTAFPPVSSWSGWSPFEGLPMRGRPVMTFLRGRVVYRHGNPVNGARGRELTFPRT